MNWYAYKALADSYDADRKRQAADHRRARQAARRRRDQAAAATSTPATAATSARTSAGLVAGTRPVTRPARSGWATLADVLHMRRHPSVSR